MTDVGVNTTIRDLVNLMSKTAKHGIRVCAPNRVDADVRYLL